MYIVKVYLDWDFIFFVWNEECVKFIKEVYLNIKFIYGILDDVDFV